MRLAPPSFLVFLLALILAVLAVVGRYRGIPYVTPNVFWFAIAAWAVLAFGCMFRRA